MKSENLNMFYGDRICFSKYFHIRKKDIDDYGAIDICLYRDLPLFIDPMLIFNSNKKEYIELHDKIIHFFHFLEEKAKCCNYNEIKHLLVFKETKNTWLGYSKTGNNGTALSEKYAKLLYRDLPFVFSENKISKSHHIEKAMLLYEGDGKDRISDMTTKLILPYLYVYTEQFTLKYIDPALSDFFYVDFNGFNYETESFLTGRFRLPYVLDKFGRKEYILLIPKDIVRADDQSINRHDLLDSMDTIIASMDNESLRQTVSNYIIKAIAELTSKYANTEKEPTEKEIKKTKRIAFEQMLSEHPEIYDYYIRMRESNTQTQSGRDFAILSLPESIDSFILLALEDLESLSSIEETRSRIQYFKHVIEDRDGYRLLWKDDNPISENDVHLLFDLIWMRTHFLITKECNNGRGPADYNISFGKENQTIVEFKLATNNKLRKVFNQINIYAEASGTKNKIIVVICFSNKDIEKYYKLLDETGNKEEHGRNIFLIDARRKESASKC